MSVNLTFLRLKLFAHITRLLDGASAGSTGLLCHYCVYFPHPAKVLGVGFQNRRPDNIKADVEIPGMIRLDNVFIALPSLRESFWARSHRLTPYQTPMRLCSGRCPSGVSPALGYCCGTSWRLASSPWVDQVTLYHPAFWSGN